MTDVFAFSQWDHPDLLEEFLASPFYRVMHISELGCLAILPKPRPYKPHLIAGWHLSYQRECAKYMRTLLPEAEEWRERGYTHVVAFIAEGGEPIVTHLPTGIFPEADERSIEYRLLQRGLPVTPNNVHNLMTGFLDGNCDGADYELDPALEGNVYEAPPPKFVKHGKKLPGWTYEQEGSQQAHAERLARLDGLTNFIAYIRQCGDQGYGPPLYETPKGWRFVTLAGAHRACNLVPLPSTINIVKNKPKNKITITTKGQLTDVVHVNHSVIPVNAITHTQINPGESYTIEITHNRAALVQALWASTWANRRAYNNQLKAAGIVYHRNYSGDHKHILPSEHVWLSEANMKLIRLAFRELMKHWHLPETTINLKEGATPEYEDKLQAQITALKQEEEHLMQKRTIMALSRLEEIAEELQSLEDKLQVVNLHRLYKSGLDVGLLKYDIREADPGYDGIKPHAKNLKHVPDAVFMAHDMDEMRYEIVNPVADLNPYDEAVEG